ncbi:ubiquitin-protein ligase E3B [Contarinia nasturtii]|uniref:ubiquitin-protein ligase E3B n=1 Tax=Contarinia nasturtii TaxID=265458 RepID=UPI0012D40B0D|nr:ubiquitin-protein ligase E3B [Contarinia nasturtii]
MFNTSESQKNDFLDKTKAAREERETKKKRDGAIIKIQSWIRVWLARINYEQRALAALDDILPPNTKMPEMVLKANVDVYYAVNRFLKISRENSDAYSERLQQVCRYLSKSLDSENSNLSYIGIALNNDLDKAWTQHIELLLYKCCVQMENLRPDTHSESLTLALYLSTLISFTTPKNWGLLKENSLMEQIPVMKQKCSNMLGTLVEKGFFQTLRKILLKGTCRKNITLKPLSFQAVLELSIRPLTTGNFTEDLMAKFLIFILSTPALIYQIEANITNSLKTFQTESILKRSLDLLEKEQNMKYVTSDMKATQCLALLANIVHLFHLEPIETATKFGFPTFTLVCMKLLQTISDLAKDPKQGSKGLLEYHELLGWTPVSSEHNENVSLIKKQLYLLWGYRTVKIILGDNLKELSVGYEKIEFTLPQQGSGNLLKRALERTQSKSTQNKASKPWRKLGSHEISRVAIVCTMYHEALETLTQLKLDILSGLCYHNTLLHDLFILIASLGLNCGLKPFLELLSASSNTLPPPLLMLLLFCDLMTHYVTILDDIEMYEQQTPFELIHYIALSSFLNNFLYKAIQENIFDLKVINSTPLFVSMHSLLLCLYRRDCRRQFAPKNHWLIYDIRPSNFLADLEKGKKHTQVLLSKMPHIIPHEDRVKLFRKYVHNEKAVLGLTESACASPSSALITIHRDRIVEDGYRQLAMLPPAALKGVIRVRFINQQGLDEAGIDQDGVFKEFLEETIKKVFDPSLNLFKTTSDQRLYPSPTSHLQDNHLQLFDFVGRMLGKAVYEGIVVDVPFAMFFLSQLLQQQALYSCIDELPSLDQELYRSLSFVKHYQGDVSDLDLTFSVDEDQMGRIVTHELYSGGRARPVTNDNKINYIHYMAFFRMHTQIKEQTIAFIHGFKTIVNLDWLSLFSTPELQRLISGDTAPLDLKDLRKHTQYYGGFHDSHRVVGWLWDILARDFTEDERKLFLKFVTSCSKPPLLGFTHLEPPFSIRCVEVGDDEDTGDTIGSVIRGFFTIRKKDPLNRLPTSSTCFNLLKLPNYQKKSTLRDKLRYAISSNTGFELS